MLEKTEDAVMNWQSIRVHKTQDEDKNKQTNKNTTHKAKKMSQDLDVLIDCRFICFWFSLYIFEMLYVFWLIDWLIVVSRQVSVILALFMTCTSLQEYGTRIDRCVYYHHRRLLKTDYRRQVVLILQGALHSLQQKSSRQTSRFHYGSKFRLSL
jgi:aldehyde:ferredoxin oxidoreductase